MVTVNAQNPVLDQLLAQGLTRDAAGALVSGEILVDRDSVLNPGWEEVRDRLNTPAA